MTFSDKLTALVRHLTTKWTESSKLRREQRQLRKFDGKGARKYGYGKTLEYYGSNETSLTIDPDNGTYNFYDGKSQVGTTGSIYDKTFIDALKDTETGRSIAKELEARKTPSVFQNIAERKVTPLNAGTNRTFFQYNTPAKMTPQAEKDIKEAEAMQNAGMQSFGGAAAHRIRFER